MPDYVIGILDPKGIFHQCWSYGHQALAYKLMCSDVTSDVNLIKDLIKPYNTTVIELGCECYLKDKGYIVFTEYGVHSEIGWTPNLHLTEAQNKWLEDNYKRFCKEKMSDIDNIYEQNKY